MHLQATKNTPEVVYLPEQATLLVKGSSMPENALEFYGPVIGWVRQHLEVQGASLTLRIEMKYFNSSSMKSIFMLLETLKSATQQGRSGRVEWLVEDDDEFMQESGQTLMELLGMELRFIHSPAA